jgi:hypothetical protein
MGLTGGRGSTDMHNQQTLMMQPSAKMRFRTRSALCAALQLSSIAWEACDPTTRGPGACVSE